MMQMMSLHTFDRAYPEEFPAHQRLSPLLSREALRRMAWSTFYLDSMADGGRYGSQTIDERAYRLQLPCDQDSFLGNDHVVTEPLIPGEPNNSHAIGGGVPHASLDMSAYLLRTAAARRRALHFAFRASYQEHTVERLSADLLDLRYDIQAVFADLPRRFQFNPDNMVLHHDRLPMFILLHVVRHNLFIILGRAALQIYLRDSAKLDLVHQVRRDRISHALNVSSLLAEGLRENIVFDPHIGIQAYVAFEILLFEPRRLASVDQSNDFNVPKITEGVVHLLTAVRNLASRSELIRHLYLEAIHRLIRCDCRHLLEQSDLTVIHSKHPLVGQDDAEFDFRDFRGAKLERLNKRARPPADDTITTTGDEVLLDDSISREPTGSPAALPQTENLASHSLEGLLTPFESSTGPGMSADAEMGDYGLLQDGQPWRELVQPENTDHLFSSLNWLWPFDEWNDQIAPPTGLSGFQ
ncbi:hypothetical protein BDW62DRAFT_217909, partial [Aspergillus aurantiobrunneus]